jgi:hypothetical protein
MPLGEAGMVDNRRKQVYRKEPALDKVTTRSSIVIGSNLMAAKGGQ